jgi:signal transduction histidine kinase
MLNDRDVRAEIAEGKREPPKGRDPLLAAICHDLRAPLAAVTMGANFVLQTTPADAGRSRRVLEAMLRSCKQMERLVRDFADLSEIEQNALELRPGIHDAHQMLEMAHAGGRASAGARLVEIAVQPARHEVLLRCDNDRMLRAIGHLLENAIRHAPEASRVTLGVHESGGEVVFTVRDLGPGLSAETLEHLYDRVWHGRRSNRVGAGLGLAIARGIVTAHGGRIEVDTKPGTTTFSLVLPRDAPSVRNLAAP